MYKPTTEQGDCIFCAIAQGKLTTPGVFWEDEKYMAFLSIDPNTEGYSCVIPKDHFASDVLKMNDSDLASFVIASKKVSHILENYFDDVGRIGLVMEGTGIDHAHIKLIPMHKTEYLKNGGWKQVGSSSEKTYFETYEGWISSAAGPRVDDIILSQLAKKIIDSQNQ